MGLCTNKNFIQFVEYVYSFYGENVDNALYPIKGCTWNVCYKTCERYVNKVAFTDRWGFGDSVDRERVRDIILAKGYKHIERKYNNES